MFKKNEKEKEVHEIILSKEQYERLFSMGEVNTVLDDIIPITIILGDWISEQSKGD